MYEASSSNVMTFGSRSFRRQLKLDDVIKCGAAIMGLVSSEEEKETTAHPLLPRENKARRQQPASQEESLLLLKCLWPGKFMYWNLNPQGMVLRNGAFEKRLGQQGGALLLGLVPLKKEERGPSPFPPSKDKLRWHHLWTRKLTLIRHQIGQHSDLWLTSLQTLKKNITVILLFHLSNLVMESYND